ncbi:MAG TPA: STAS domain-containing protein [Acidimicrobiales bacterium]|nr:STAS domain-containing protein [Acidimicrobiales bacterium]
MPRSFDIQVAAEGPDLVARVSGELDLAVRAQLVARVSDALSAADPPGRLVADLGDVTFCDSSGLAALLDLQRVATDTGFRLMLRDVPPQVARLLDLTDVDGWLPRE